MWAPLATRRPSVKGGTARAPSGASSSGGHDAGFLHPHFGAVPAHAGARLAGWGIGARFRAARRSPGAGVGDALSAHPARGTHVRGRLAGGKRRRRPAAAAHRAARRCGRGRARVRRGSPLARAAARGGERAPAGGFGRSGGALARCLGRRGGAGGGGGGPGGDRRARR
ncbi:MAG: hypothetical protein B7X99_01210 [Rhizobiales bacterium 17-65-6]|nr:MAG: hypothetical protein B7X99_01210 [Rhizobiales bacterium 17-65-6]